MLTCQQTLCVCGCMDEFLFVSVKTFDKFQKAVFKDFESELG